MPIPWSVVRTSEVRDGLGRAVNWSTLKRARIYMCGHGGHLFRDGYCSVPSDTTLNFYQTYGRAMINQHAMAFIRDKSASLALERSFIPGQSCPDMTLFEDDDSELEPTTAALQQRVQNDPNCYVFNTNQFTGLSLYQEATPHPFNGKKTLRLSDILSVLNGNTLEWMCCQDLMGWRKQSVDGRLDTVIGHRRAAAEGEASRTLERRKRFSAKVQTGLRVTELVARELPGASGLLTDPGFDVFLGGTAHSEGVGSTRYAPVQFLNKARTGQPLARDPTSRAGLPVRKDFQDAQGRLRQSYLVWQQDLVNGLNSLNVDPQPNAGMDERVWAKVKLEQALTRIAGLIARLSLGVGDTTVIKKT